MQGIVPRTKAGSWETAIKYNKECTAMTVDGQRTQDGRGGRARRAKSHKYQCNESSRKDGEPK